MDIALSIEALVPVAQYGGVPADEASYNALRWEDSRAKPTWTELQAAWIPLAKEQKKAEIKAAYLEQRTTVNKGITSATLNAEIDCRESDFVNMKSMYDLMVATGQTELNKGYKCKDNETYIACTTEQLGQVVVELGLEISSMWDKQDDLCAQVDVCSTEAEINVIEWSW